jgi:hypothetical protein
MRITRSMNATSAQGLASSLLLTISNLTQPTTWISHLESISQREGVGSVSQGSKTCMKVPGINSPQRKGLGGIYSSHSKTSCWSYQVNTGPSGMKWQYAQRSISIEDPYPEISLLKLGNSSQKSCVLFIPNPLVCNTKPFGTALNSTPS